MSHSALKSEFAFHPDASEYQHWLIKINVHPTTIGDFGFKYIWIIFSVFPQIKAYALPAAKKKRLFSFSGRWLNTVYNKINHSKEYNNSEGPK